MRVGGRRVRVGNESGRTESEGGEGGEGGE